MEAKHLSSISSQKVFSVSINKDIEVKPTIPFPDPINNISSYYKLPIFFSVHPRTKKILQRENIQVDFVILDPIGYLEMIYMLQNCKMVMTDSGGLQKEAFFFKKNCITLRDETEWVELVENGFNMVVGADPIKIIDAYYQMIEKDNNFDINLYGNGLASKVIAQNLINEY